VDFFFWSSFSALSTFKIQSSGARSRSKTLAAHGSLLRANIFFLREDDDRRRVGYRPNWDTAATDDSGRLPLPTHQPGQIPRHSPLPTRRAITRSQFVCARRASCRDNMATASPFSSWRGLAPLRENPPFKKLLVLIARFISHRPCLSVLPSQTPSFLSLLPPS
jgi:hypothetical protein